MTAPGGLLDKARESLAAAELLLRGNLPDSASSRACYAMLQAAGALVSTTGRRHSSHRAVIAAIGRDFVKSGRLERRHHRALIDAFDSRQVADYDGDRTVDQDTARRHVEDARAFLAAIEDLVSRDS